MNKFLDQFDKELMNSIIDFIDRNRELIMERWKNDDKIRSLHEKKTN